MKSIRRQLLLALLATIFLTLLLGALATYRMARDEADAIFDYHLRQLALSVRDQAFQSDLRERFDIDEDARDYSIQVWSRDGTRIYLSHPSKELPGQAPIGLATIDTGRGKWRVFGLQTGGQTIQVAQPLQIREQLALSAALRTVVPFLMLMPILGVLIWVVVGRGLRPLDAVARAVTTRTASALDPLPENHVPTEALPLVRSLNDLLVRLQRALEGQREFIADAAHELRTPLAALSLQVQLAERAADPASRADAFVELKAGLQRATHTVQQLLTLARQEPGSGDRPPRRIDLAAVVAGVLAEQHLLAEARGVDLGASSTVSSAWVDGDEESLRILVANLVANAIRHTPAAGRVDLEVRPGNETDGPSFSVSDSGPGIPPEERERVFDRFYRRGQSDESGSGLGLAIVKAIVERHRAQIVLDQSDLGGLRACVRFPPASLPPSPP